MVARPGVVVRAYEEGGSGAGCAAAGALFAV